MMKIDVTTSNPALVSIIQDPSQIITLDANFLIPPNRSQAKVVISFKQFQEIWLDPIFSAFPNLAIHESVYDELVKESPKNYVDAKYNDVPPGILIHKDSLLSEVEKLLRDTIESKIAPLTKYEPLLDNKHDRGEVKSLSYIAVKGLLYFAAHDNNALQLVEKSKLWSTGLDSVQAIKMYELIFYLHTKGLSNKKALRALYKYQYHLTDYEQKTNPEWGDFILAMEKLYSAYFNVS